VSRLPASAYELLGGESAVRDLVDRFYDVMDRLPQARGIRAMHPQDLTGSREKLFLFLSGWLGGPPLYQEKYGHPRLKLRHMPFPIAAAERDAWLSCMDLAMRELDYPDSLRQRLMNSFAMTANHMRNQ
jgi:hemoglobin